MNTSSQGRGAVLLDGAHYENALAWLYQQYPDQQPLPLLIGTAYEPIADAGPILLNAPAGSPAYEDWRSGRQMEDALWLESDAATEQLWCILQRRLRILTPDHSELWLRLADARPLRRVYQAQEQWPEGFWHSIQGVWLRHEDTPICAWRNLNPQLDSAPLKQGIEAQLTLGWPLLEALMEQDGTTQDEDV